MASDFLSKVHAISQQTNLFPTLSYPNLSQLVRVKEKLSSENIQSNYDNFFYELTYKVPILIINISKHNQIIIT